MRSGLARPLNVCSPRSVTSAVTSSSPITPSVTADMRIWPPCPALAMRAQRLSVGPYRSPSRSITSPVWSPMRTGSSSMSCASRAASSARAPDQNTAPTPSPVCLNTRPPCASMTRCRTRSWSANAVAIETGSSRHRCVDASMSVNKIVTVRARRQPCDRERGSSARRGHPETCRRGYGRQATVQDRAPTPQATRLRVPGAPGSDRVPCRHVT